jgi:DNA-binding MarR family transcriptional regulator
MTITNTEAKLLSVLSEDDGANLYELASSAKLTTSEVRRALSRLLDDHLAEEVEKKERDAPHVYVKLTEEGKRVRRSLSGSGQVFRGFGAFVVPERVPDVAAEADLDAALDAEIHKG